MNHDTTASTKNPANGTSTHGVQINDHDRDRQRASSHMMAVVERANSKTVGVTV